MIKQKGGKFIGTGQYGCVFSPPLNCNKLQSRKSKSVKREKKVGKIFYSNKEGYKELINWELMRRIDPSNNFTVKFIEYCIIDNNTLKLEDKNKDCEKFYNESYNFKEKYDNYLQIISDYGGISFDKIDLENFNINKFLIGLKSLFNGLLVLDKANLIHMDIASRNLLYNLKKKKFLLIDFGLALENKHLLNHTHFFESDSEIYPPEFKLYYCFKQDGMKLTERIFKSLMFREKWRHMEKFYVLCLDMDIHQFEEQIEGLFREYKKHFNKGGIKAVEKLLLSTNNKIDLFSLGILLLKTLYKYLKIVEYNNYLNLSLIKLIKNMINMNPFLRYNPKEILREFNRYLKYIK